MIRYAIVEDSLYATENLKNMVSKLRHDFELAFTSTSVKNTIDCLRKDDNIDLVFMDIELDDGKCWAIFDSLPLTIPIIFTTAYDEYAIRAFKVNGVDYLLKPIDEKELSHALDKFEFIYSKGSANKIEINSIISEIEKKPTTRILTVTGDRYNYINLSDVAFFKSEDNYIFAFLNDGSKRMINITNLSELSELLPQDKFNRLTRGVIVSIDAIASVSKFFRQRLHVKIKAGNLKEDVYVSSANREGFLKWLGR
ncbi:MAG: LytTR family DNA-binding domain-containing protein [Muribaculaceae bacterium]|nr:LytTR family DNA-binding domain-containing protein [Muribaculaceae bacterium]